MHTRFFNTASIDKMLADHRVSPGLNNNVQGLLPCKVLHPEEEKGRGEVVIWESGTPWVVTIGEERHHLSTLVMDVSEQLDNVGQQEVG